MIIYIIKYLLIRIKNTSIAGKFNLFMRLMNK